MATIGRLYCTIDFGWRFYVVKWLALPISLLPDAAIKGVLRWVSRGVKVGTVHGVWQGIRCYDPRLEGLHKFRLYRPPVV